METKKCTFCGEVKPVTEFYKKSKSKDGYQTYCKACQHEITKEAKARMRLKDKETMSNEETPIQVPESAVPTPMVEDGGYSLRPVKKTEVVKIEDRVLTRETIDLSKVTSRTLLEELKKRGYF